MVELPCEALAGLGLSEGSYIKMELDEENGRLMLMPCKASEESTTRSPISIYSTLTESYIDCE